MKKVILFSLIILITMSAGSVNAADGDMWDYFGDQNVYGQKPVSDKEFEDTVKHLEEKKTQNKKDERGKFPSRK